jgi:hypothetical protein
MAAALRRAWRRVHRFVCVRDGIAWANCVLFAMLELTLHYRSGSSGLPVRRKWRCRAPSPPALRLDVLRADGRGPRGLGR